MFRLIFLNNWDLFCLGFLHIIWILIYFFVAQIFFIISLLSRSFHHCEIYQKWNLWCRVVTDDDDDGFSINYSIWKITVLILAYRVNVKERKERGGPEGARAKKRCYRWAGDASCGWMFHSHRNRWWTVSGQSSHGWMVCG